MSPHNKARAAFVFALILLFAGGVAAYVSIHQLLNAQLLVSRCREAQAATGEVESAAVRVGRARMGYVDSGNATFLTEFNTAREDVPQHLQKLKELLADDENLLELGKSLESVTEQRVQLARQAIDLKIAHPHDDHGQDKLSLQSVALLSQTTQITRKIRDQEDRLLVIRQHVLHRDLAISFGILFLTLLSAVCMLSLHYRLLNRELLAREQAEQASRGLSRRLMDVQDEERRRFSRELHDSLGQHLAVIKMTLERMASKYDSNSQWSDCVRLVAQAISETRTISHLLHPPLLDMAGFCSAARWFVDGFAERSGIRIVKDIQDLDTRLARPVEAVLFRILQESLTNIHRYAKCSTAKVVFTMHNREILLTVEDDGIGIAEEVMVAFRERTTSGVGLAGMRERVQELGGKFELQSGNAAGTKVIVVLPLAP